jgi:hypothetical protein
VTAKGEFEFEDGSRDIGFFEFGPEILSINPVPNSGGRLFRVQIKPHLGANAVAAFTQPDKYQLTNELPNGIRLTAGLQTV